jgi:hypothetical protein
MGSTGKEISKRNMLPTTTESLQAAMDKYLVKLGRPTKYTEELAAEIITSLQAGVSMLKVSERKHMPHISSIYRWQGELPAFREACAYAQRMRTHAMVDEGQAILDSCDDSSGNAPVAKARERANFRLAIAKCRNKEDYGDNIQVNQHVVTETMSDRIKRLTGAPVVIPVEFAHVVDESDS